MPEVKGLLNSSGTFVPFQKETLASEIATRQNAGSFFEMGQWLSFLPDPDHVLKKRGDDAAILAELYADDQVTTATLSRKNRVLNCPHYGFRAGSPDGETPKPESEHIYQRLAQDLERTNLRNIISNILDAPFYGMVPLEILWACGDGWWHIVDIVARPYHWFAFDMQNQPLFRGDQGWFGSDPQPLPPGKFVLVTHHATYDNPYGLHLLSRCLWPVTFKRGGMQFYAKFVERYGLPWAVSKAPPKATRQEKQGMATDLARMVQDCVAVLPAGSEIQLLTATSGQDLIHERFLSRQDKAISKLLMGQTLTIEMEGRNNSQAAASTHDDVADGLAQSDKAMVSDTFNEIAWLYTQVNMGTNVFAPLFSYEEPEDLIARAELDKKLVDMGVEFTAEHFADNYNLKSTEFTVRAPLAPALFSAHKKAETKTPVALAETAQKQLDTSIKNLLPDVLKTSNVFISKLNKTIESAKSFDELQLNLAKLLAPRMSPTEFENILAQTMTAAAGYGATAVNGEQQKD